VVSNINLEIGNQQTVANTIALNANHSRIEQFHVEFLIFDQNFLDVMNNNKEA
jgi:hypothetical protein